MNCSAICVTDHELSTAETEKINDKGTQPQGKFSCNLCDTGKNLLPLAVVFVATKGMETFRGQ